VSADPVAISYAICNNLVSSYSGRESLADD
jgi:hypothetical protein